MMIDSCSYAPFGTVVRSSYNVSSICDFLEEIARHKLFRPISLRKSLATNFFGPFPQEIGHSLTHSFPQEIACHKTFSAHFLRKSLATNFFGSFPQEIGRHKTFSAHFLRKSATHLLTHFLRKSLGWASTHFLEEIAGTAYIELTL